MRIEILGMGCAKCHKLEEDVWDAIQELGVEVLIVSVQDIKKIMGYGVMTTPALVVDGEVMMAGKNPTKDEIKKWLVVNKDIVAVPVSGGCSSCGKCEMDDTVVNKND
jgi:small redox-active disulfide protein 2